MKKKNIIASAMLALTMVFGMAGGNSTVSRARTGCKTMQS